MCNSKGLVNPNINSEAFFTNEERLRFRVLVYHFIFNYVKKNEKK